MNKLPQLAVNIAVGAGVVMGVHEVFELGVTHSQTSQERVEHCANALGNLSITGTALSDACGDYLNGADITAVKQANGHQVAELRLPTAAEFLTQELPGAVDKDRSRHSNYIMYELLGFMIGGGLAVGAMGLTDKAIERVENRVVTFRSGKQAVKEAEQELAKR